METINKIALSGLSEADIIELMVDDNLEKFRAKQIHSWLYAKVSDDIELWTDLSVDLREKIKEKYIIPKLQLANHQRSQKDPTEKYLFQTEKGHYIESVLMSFRDRDSLTACISSQVGCAVGCPFCATGKLGFKANLHYSEIVDQVMSIQRKTGKKIHNLVYMGQGEPLNNYDNVVQSIEVFRKSVGIGVRNITVSTSGVVPKIKALGETGLAINLAVSLHSARQTQREVLVPVAKRWDLLELTRCLEEYFQKTKRRITFEYTLLEGINDSIDDAWALCDYVRDLPFSCLINLIPYNETSGEFRKPKDSAIHKFQEIVSRSGRKTTVRITLGDDISAACGQLSNKHQQATEG